MLAYHSALHFAGRSAAVLTEVSLLAISIALLGCGGNNSSSTPPPPPTVTVSVSPSSMNVLLGDTQQFTATVSGSSNTLVNWSVNETAGGNSKVGTISSTGLYTAPADLPSPASVTITAASQASPSSTANASVTVTSDVKIALSTSLSGRSSVQTNATVQMTATITSAGHPDTNVTWSINAVTNGNSTLGTITTTNGGAATYTAPAALPTPNTVTVQATSEADPSQSASVTARIDIPVQQYYSLTGSNGLATFALSTPSSSAQARRAVIHPNSPGPIAQSSSSGPTLQIEAIDQNTQAPVEGIGISLSTDVAGDAAIVLSDSAGRYYTSSQILELPSSSTGTPAPIQVTIPPVVTPSSGSSTGTVNSIPVPSVNSSNVLTPNQESVSEQNWEGDRKSVV